MRAILDDMRHNWLNWAFALGTLIAFLWGAL